MKNPLENQWALILGASSGFGAATALELARAGMHIFGVHLDRKATMENVENVRSGIEKAGRNDDFSMIDELLHKSLNPFEDYDILEHPDKRFDIFISCSSWKYIYNKVKFEFSKVINSIRL